MGQPRTLALGATARYSRSTRTAPISGPCIASAQPLLGPHMRIAMEILHRRDWCYQATLFMESQLTAARRATGPCLPSTQMAPSSGPCIVSLHSTLQITTERIHMAH